MKNMYAKGRSYEYDLVHTVNKIPGLKATRVLLSGQRGEGDVIIQAGDTTLATEMKARKEVPKTVYEWLGKHDLLVMKKIGREYGWLVTLRLDHFLALLALLQSAPVDRIPNNADIPPKRGHKKKFWG